MKLFARILPICRDSLLITKHVHNHQRIFKDRSQECRRQSSFRFCTSLRNRRRLYLSRQACLPVPRAPSRSAARFRLSRDWKNRKRPPRREHARNFHAARLRFFLTIFRGNPIRFDLPAKRFSLERRCIVASGATASRRITFYETRVHDPGINRVARC